MTTNEFSQQFDIFYNNITSNQAPGLNEYEKSVFLTKAELQLTKEYFNNKIDSVGGGFDGGEKRQYDFSSLIKTSQLKSYVLNNLSTYKKIDRRSHIYQFPNDYFLSVNEILTEAKGSKNYDYSIIPIDFLEYQRQMSKPYSLPPKKIAWRLITGVTTQPQVATANIDTPTVISMSTELEGNDTENSISTTSVTFLAVEIIGTFKNTTAPTYTIRYVKKPTPIILTDLSVYSEDITIDGLSEVTECILPEEMHEEILERAVLLAKAVWQNSIQGTQSQQ